MAAASPGRSRACLDVPPLLALDDESLEGARRALLANVREAERRLKQFNLSNAPDKAALLLKTEEDEQKHTERRVSCEGRA